MADVSAVADPATGVAVYDSFKAGGWLVFGGTSVAAPVVASVFALAGNAAGTDSASYPYGHTTSSFSASTMIVTPARNSFQRMRSESGSSTMRWMARRRGRAPNVGS